MLRQNLILSLVILSAFCSDTMAYSFTSLSFSPLTGSGCSPQIFCPPDVTIEGDLNDGYLTGLPHATIASTDCGTPSISYSDEYIDTECGTIVNRVWVASSFNSLTQFDDINVCQQKITVNPPCELICPPNSCVTGNDSVDPSVLGSASADNDCALMDLKFEDSNSSICNGARLISRVWIGRFQGYENCEYTCVQSITIGDNDAPVISNCPTDITVDSNCDDVHWEEPTALDNCVNSSISSNYLPGQSGYALGTTLIEYTASDACGNVSVCSFNVIVQNDRTFANCPDDIIVETTDGCYAYPQWDAPDFDSNCTECPPADPIPGFMNYGSFNGSDYYISKGTYSIEQAQMIARQKGGYLVSINSEEENNYIASQLRSQSVHIGLSDVVKEGTFVWADGSKLTYTNWFLNQPNNQFGNQDYVEMLNDGSWNDTQAKNLCFIMEIPCDFVKQVSGPRSGYKLKAGTHTVNYVIENGCGEFYCCSFDIVVNDTQSSLHQGVTNLDLSDNNRFANTVETNAQDNKDLKLLSHVYPNPFADYFNIELENASELKSISMTNQVGQLVLTKASSFSKNETFEVGHLPEGVYFVIFEYQDGERAVKMVLKD